MAAAIGRLNLKCINLIGQWLPSLELIKLNCYSNFPLAFRDSPWDHHHLIRGSWKIGADWPSELFHWNHLD